ncbi:LOB domain-containing protein 1-like [Andrographis paniculata]|uniref:LOB domain-containing protein 1-like n=1 Tax=Andrographis paniculata TaxID=175694 RepID=UPI0021E8BA29|nr:LOB domain-containing protein 1-like [Andrographis paniculata]
MENTKTAAAVAGAPAAIAIPEAAMVEAAAVGFSPSSLSPTSSSSSPNSSSSSAAAPAVILSPCAACKILRRRCVEKCVLAPYFPPTDPLKFTIAHRVFGASNIIKLLQELPESQRADAVNSMVYEANARLRDPVYGCAGAICHLQNQLSELKAELAKAQAEILNMQCQNSNLFDLICKQIVAPNDIQQIASLPQSPPSVHENNPSFYFDESILGVAWEPLWT